MQIKSASIILSLVSHGLWIISIIVYSQYFWECYRKPCVWRKFNKNFFVSLMQVSFSYFPSMEGNASAWYLMLNFDIMQKKLLPLCTQISIIRANFYMSNHLNLDMLLSILHKITILKPHHLINQFLLLSPQFYRCRNWGIGRLSNYPNQSSYKWKSRELNKKLWL